MRSGIISMLLILLFASCEHKDLCYSHPHDKEVRILFDWSNIHVDNIPKVVAVIFRNEETNTVAEFALPPEGGIVMIPDGAYEFTAYNIGQYGNIFKETNAGRIATTPVSHKLKGKYYETPDFFVFGKPKSCVDRFRKYQVNNSKTYQANSQGGL